MTKLYSLLLMFAVTMSAQADDYFDTVNAQKNDYYAGVYMSIPLGGANQKARKDQFKFGFSIDYRQQKSLSFRPNNNRPFQVKGYHSMRMFDVNFNQQGLQKVTLAQLPLLRKGLDGRYIYLADNEDGEERGLLGKTLFWTGVIVGGGLLLWMIEDCVRGPDDEIIEVCPVD